MNLLELRLMFPLMPEYQLKSVIMYMDKATEYDLTRLYHDFKQLGLDPDRAIALAEVLTRPPEITKPLEHFTPEYLCSQVSTYGGWYNLARNIKDKLGCATEPMSAAEMSSCLWIHGWDGLAETLNARVQRMRQEGKV